jgi:hypothetical protein
MKSLFVILLVICHSGAIAAGFVFTPKKNLFDNQIELINAILKLSPIDKEYTCLVDTGARYTIFKESILKDLPKIGETVGGGISNISQAIDLVNVDLGLGDWILTDTTVARTNTIPFDCLIGNNFFINRNFQIDFNKNEISDLSESIDIKKSFPLHIYKNELGGHFGFEMKLANKTVETIFDTGATSTVVSLAFVVSNPEHFKLIKEINVTDGNTTELKAGLYELDEISFGDTTLKKIQVYVLDLSNLKSKLPNVDIVLGLNVIQNFNWQFDTQNFQYLYNHKK